MSNLSASAGVMSGSGYTPTEEKMGFVNMAMAPDMTKYPLEVTALVSNMPGAFLEMNVEQFQGIESNENSDRFFNELNEELQFMQNISLAEQELLTLKAAEVASRKFVELNLGVGLEDLEDGKSVSLAAYIVKRVGNRFEFKLNGEWVHEGDKWINKPLIPTVLMAAQQAIPVPGRTTPGGNTDKSSGKKPRNKWVLPVIISTAAVITALIFSRPQASASSPDNSQSLDNNGGPSQFDPSIPASRPTNDDILVNPTTKPPFTPTVSATETAVPLTLEQKRAVCMDFEQDIRNLHKFDSNEGAPMYGTSEGNPELVKSLKKFLELASRGELEGCEDVISKLRSFTLQRFADTGSLGLDDITFTKESLAELEKLGIRIVFSSFEEKPGEDWEDFPLTEISPTANEVAYYLDGNGNLVVDDTNVMITYQNGMIIGYRDPQSLIAAYKQAGHRIGKGSNEVLAYKLDFAPDGSARITIPGAGPDGLSGYRIITFIAPSDSLKDANDRTFTSEAESDGQQAGLIWVSSASIPE